MKKMFENSGRKSDAPSSSSAASAPCPPDRDELGRHSWTLLHTMAAYFPDSPKPDESAAALSLLSSLSLLYPCSHCAADFRESLADHPPQAGSRAELSVWMCKAHNRVNRMLGKAEFPCILSQLDERWRTGGSHCDESGLQSTDD